MEMLDRFWRWVATPASWLDRNQPQTLRRRVSFHEAAHAVLVVTSGFILEQTFLNTPNGTIGGYTGWLPRPARPLTALEQAEAEATVFLAGQCAERHLARAEPFTLVPARDRNWDDDEAHLAMVLERPVIVEKGAAKRSLLKRTRRLVHEHWETISRVATELERAAPPGPQQPLAQLRQGVVFVPASRVIPSEEVRRHVLDGELRAVASRIWQARGKPRGPRVDDWREAEREVASRSPELVFRWMAEENGPNQQRTARFVLPSAQDANTVRATLSAFPPVTATTSGEHILVEFPSGMKHLVELHMRRTAGLYCRPRFVE